MKVLSAVPWQLGWDHTGLSRRLLGQLSAISAAGATVELCSHGEDADFGSFRNRKVGVNLMKGEDPLIPLFNSISFSLAFSKIADAEECDVLHCFNTTSLFIRKRGYILQMLNPTSAFVREMIEGEYPREGKYLRKIEAYDISARLEERECSSAERIIVSSEMGRGSVERFYGRDGRDVEVIPTGVDPSSVRQDYEKQKNRLKIILFPNRVSVMKGFRYMAEAMEEIRREYPSSLLVVSGRIDGFDSELMLPYIKRLREMGCATLTGFISRDALLSYYEMADVVVVPSLCDDLSLSLLDAIAMSTPLVATENTGFPRVGEVGIKVSPKDSSAIAEGAIRLLSDERLYREKREGAKKVVKDYFWTEIGKRYMDVYNRHLGDQPSSSR
mgnify:CR=1 FL=1